MVSGPGMPSTIFFTTQSMKTQTKNLPLQWVLRLLWDGLSSLSSTRAEKQVGTLENQPTATKVRLETSRPMVSCLFHYIPPGLKNGPQRKLRRNCRVEDREQITAEKQRSQRNPKDKITSSPPPLFSSSASPRSILFFTVNDYKNDWQRTAKDFINSVYSQVRLRADTPTA